MTIDPSSGNHLSPGNITIKSTHIVPKVSAPTSEPLTPTSQNTAKDVLSLSSEQGEYDHLINAIQQTPDIREEKVKKIKEALESGHYHISSEDIADRIIREAIADSTRTLR
ncbi:flagellar biosynthesis anti-sigma factor FlgM [Nitrospira sp. M1]